MLPATPDVRSGSMKRNYRLMPTEHESDTRNGRDRRDGVGGGIGDAHSRAAPQWPACFAGDGGRRDDRHAAYSNRGR